MANHKKRRQYSPNRCTCKWWKMGFGKRDDRYRPNEQRQLPKRNDE